jgi:ABC-type bacteriocin/lantibiotic exporter with double-glycine peptidase domain
MRTSLASFFDQFFARGKRFESVFTSDFVAVSSDSQTGRQNSNKEILHKLLLRLGEKPRYLAGNDKATIGELIKLNNIYSRLIKLPKVVNTRSYRPFDLICFSRDLKQTYLLEYTLTKPKISSIVDGRLVELPTIPELSAFGYEIYPSLSFDLKKPFDLLVFAYGAEVKPLISLILVSIVVLICGLSIPILSGVLVSDVIPQGNSQMLFACLAIILFVLATSTISQYIQGILMLRIETKADLKLQTAVWDRFFKLPNQVITSFNLGDLYVRLSSISRIRSQLNAGAMSSLLQAVFSISYIFLMYIYSPTLTVCVLLLTILYIAFVIYFGKKSIAVWVKLYQFKAEISGQSFETTEIIQTLKVYSAQRGFSRSWLGKFRSISDLVVKADFYSQSISLVTSSMTSLGTVLFFVVFTQQVFANPEILDNPALVGNFVAFYVAFIAFNTAITSAVTALVYRFAIVVALWDYAQPLILKPIEPSFAPDSIVKSIDGSIQVMGLTVKPKDRDVELFSKLTFNVEAGEFYGVKGAQGSGKSTLLRILAGTELVEYGKVMIDHLPLDRLADFSKRKQIISVPHFPQYNPRITMIEFLDPTNTKTKEQISAALASVGLELPVIKGHSIFDANLTLESYELDTSTKMQINIARAYLCNPRILLIDQPMFDLSDSVKQVIARSLASQSFTRVVASNSEMILRHCHCILDLSSSKA